MRPLLSGSLGWFGARQDHARRCLATVLLAIFCFALAPSIEAPAQTAPWDIENIQLRLEDLGYDIGDVDGLLGPKTRAALRAFQADRGLPITGLPDGNTQRALFAAEPSESAAAAPTPSDDPPSLDAVPLVPVRVAPLAPLVKGNPHKGFSVELILAEQPVETAPPVSTNQGLALMQGDTSAEPELEPWDSWYKWAAAALAALGVVVFFAAIGRRSARQKTVVAKQPQPSPATPPSTTTPTTTTAGRGGHVFGVDVPPP